jgi:hypothetical protein
MLNRSSSRSLFLLALFVALTGPIPDRISAATRAPDSLPPRAGAAQSAAESPDAPPDDSDDAPPTTEPSDDADDAAPTAEPPGSAPGPNRPWRAAAAVGSPRWLHFAATQRTRYEHLWNQFRPRIPGNDKALSLRTTFLVELRFDPVAIGVELADSRTWRTTIPR